jgi:hypothetical protein
MDRAGDSAMSALVQHVETTADIVAAELLAPRQAVLAELGDDAALNHESIACVLQTRFALPGAYAQWYARRLAQQMNRPKSFSETLGL